MVQMRLIRHFAAARRLVVVSVLVLAPALAWLPDAAACGRPSTTPTPVPRRTATCRGSSGTSSPRSSAARSARCPALRTSTRSCLATPPISPAPWYSPTARRMTPPRRSPTRRLTRTSRPSRSASMTRRRSTSRPRRCPARPSRSPRRARTRCSSRTTWRACSSKLTARVGRQDLIVQLAIYPGEVEAVIAGNNGEARAVTATYAGALTVGSLAAFEGPRNGIDFSQLVPGVIQRLTELITTKGKVRLAQHQPLRAHQLPARRQLWLDHLPGLGQHPVPGTRARQRPADHHP